MNTVEKLSQDDKVFLAGCIESMIMADGHIESSEIEDLNRILDQVEFADQYEDCLVEFNEEVVDEETFWEKAREIESKEVQDLILEIIEELSLQDGFSGIDQDHLFHRLEQLWER